MRFTITPADKGIFAAAFDDAIVAGYGDDDTVEMIRQAAIFEAGFDEQVAGKIAYDFFRAATGRA